MLKIENHLWGSNWRIKVRGNSTYWPIWVWIVLNNETHVWLYWYYTLVFCFCRCHCICDTSSYFCYERNGFFWHYIGSLYHQYCTNSCGCTRRLAYYCGCFTIYIILLKCQSKMLWWKRWLPAKQSVASMSFVLIRQVHWQKIKIAFAHRR